MFQGDEKMKITIKKKTKKTTWEGRGFINLPPPLHLQRVRKT